MYWQASIHTRMPPADCTLHYNARAPFYCNITVTVLCICFGRHILITPSGATSPAPISACAVIKALRRAARIRGPRAVLSPRPGPAAAARVVRRERGVGRLAIDRHAVPVARAARLLVLVARREKGSVARPKLRLRAGACTLAAARAAQRHGPAQPSRCPRCPARTRAPLQPLRRRSSCTGCTRAGSRWPGLPCRT